MPIILPNIRQKAFKLKSLLAEYFQIDMPENTLDPIIFLRDAWTKNLSSGFGSIYEGWKITKALSEELNKSNKGSEISEYRITNLVKEGIIRGEISTKVIDGVKKTESKISLNDVRFISRLTYQLSNSEINQVLHEATDEDGRAVLAYTPIARNKNKLVQIADLYFATLKDLIKELDESERKKFLAKLQA